MATFMDVHNGMRGITSEQLAEAHAKDQAAEKAEGVRFIKAWADPGSGKAFCLSEGPSKEAIQRVHQKAGHPSDEIYELSVFAE